MAGRRRRRVKEIDDDIEVFSFNCRSIKKIPRRSPERLRQLPLAGHRERPPENVSDSIPEIVCHDLLLGPSSTVDAPDDEARNKKSAYFKKKEKKLEKWDEIQDSLMHCFIENCCIPEEQSCVICGEEEAKVRCKDCGHQQFFCLNCALYFHNKRNCLHMLEEWKEGTFTELEYTPELCLPQGIVHMMNCFKSTRQLCIITNAGYEKYCKVTFCSCVPDAFVLIKHGFWPVSPTCPSVAVTLELMDILEAFFLEAQVSLNSFCSALRWRNISSGKSCLVSDLYNNLTSNDTFEQYRHFMYKIRFLRTLCPDVNNGTECPACPKDGIAPTFWNFDACFGLFRKKSAGKFPFPSLHGPLYFEEQEFVDNYLAKCKTSQKEKGSENLKECSQFQAGTEVDAIHSKGKSKLFDEKAVFGCVCRHEFPLRFLDIKHGERFGYITYLLEQLLEDGRNIRTKRNVIYDIGCKLDRHIELADNQKLLGKVTCMVPAFHAFAHSTSCQMKYSIMYQDGAGLSNGEQCERLWSYLRRFSNITREMTASHRQDALTDALLYYSHKTRMKAGLLAASRLKRANDAYKTSSAELSNLLEDLPVEKDQVIEWKKQLTNLSKNRMKETSESTEQGWQLNYVRLLLLKKQLSENLSHSCDSEENMSVNPLLNKMKRVEAQLKRLEESNNVRRRWTIDQQNIKNHVCVIESEERQEAIEKLRVMSFDRWFLLSLKKKYATGQKIAKMLSKSINIKVSNIKQTIRIYNSRPAVKMNLVPDTTRKIDCKDALDIQSALYRDLPSFDSEAIPSEVKRKAVELDVMRHRAREEIELCKQDMACIMQHLIGEKMKIASAIHRQSGLSRSKYTRGALSLLKGKLSDFESLISYNGKMFVDEGGLSEELVNSLLSTDATTSIQKSNPSRFYDSDVEDEVEEEPNQFDDFAFEERTEYDPGTYLSEDSV